MTALMAMHSQFHSNVHGLTFSMPWGAFTNVVMPIFADKNAQYGINASSLLKNNRASFESWCETTPTHFVGAFLRCIEKKVRTENRGYLSISLKPCTSCAMGLH